MTVAEFKKNCEANSNGANFFEFISKSLEIWDNDSCCGYAIAALWRHGVSDAEIRKIMDCMKAAFDELTVDEARQIYCKSPF